MINKFVYAGNWGVRMPDGNVLYLNTEEGADTILGLWEYIDSLEARLKRRSNRRKKRTESFPSPEATEPAMGLRRLSKRPMEAEYEENIRAV